ncbi:hypothetical protein MMC30_009152 [Trapelia coarctata]|nr:hypothetical protein [Trapelia coarctata]
MESASKSQMRRVRTALDALVTERNDLETKLTYAESTIFALVRQNRELDNMLAETQAELTKRAGAGSLTNRIYTAPKAAATTSTLGASPSIHGSMRLTGTDWIGGSWLVVPASNSLLGPTESAWQEGKTQEALNLLTAVSNRDDLYPAEEIEVDLLFSAILRAARQPRRALEYAEKALRISDEYGLVEVVGKIYFHRGLSFLHISRYADAAWCFVLASSTEGHVQQAEANWEIAEKKRMENYPWAGISEAL